MGVWLTVYSTLFVTNHKGKVATAHLGFAVDDDLIAEFFDDALHEFGADFFVSHFAATEDNHDFNSVAIVEQFEDFAAFNIEVIFPNFQTKSDLLKFGSFGVLLGTSLFFHLLVLVFTPIDNFYNRRIGVW